MPSASFLSFISVSFSVPFVSNFTNPTQVECWKVLIYKLGLHYVNKYGIREVSEWNFESWNEPDHEKNRYVEGSAKIQNSNINLICFTSP